MIAVIKPGVTEEQLNNLVDWFKSQGLRVHVSEGEFRTVLGLIGDTTKVDIDLLSGLDIIESVTRISEPFKNANRKFHPDDSVIDVGGVKIGGGGISRVTAVNSQLPVVVMICIDPRDSHLADFTARTGADDTGLAFAAHLDTVVALRRVAGIYGVRADVRMIFAVLRRPADIVRLCRAGIIHRQRVCADLRRIKGHGNDREHAEYHHE